MISIIPFPFLIKNEQLRKTQIAKLEGKLQLFSITKYYIVIKDNFYDKYDIGQIVGL